MVISWNDRRIVWKKENDEYTFHCTECDSVWKGTSKEKKAYMKAGICPHCFNEVKVSKENDEIFRKPYSITEDEVIKGHVAYYKVKATGNEIIRDDWMFRQEGNKKFKRDYHIYYSTGSWQYYAQPDFEPTGEWKRTYSPNWGCVFWNEESGLFNSKLRSKKDYLESNVTVSLKSNQEYIVKHELMNPKQIVAMAVFNLNHLDEVWRNNKWIKANVGYTKPKCEISFNVHDLDYMKNNAINFSDYIDYRKGCKEFGIVNKHPKNFKEADAELNRIRDEKEVENKQKEFGKQLFERFTNLSQIKGKDLQIVPYKDAYELYHDAEEFHCCIYRMYTDKYAKGETDLYRCTNHGQLIACIEIKDGKVEQIRGKYNAKVKEERTIEKLCRQLSTNMTSTAMATI